MEVESTALVIDIGTGSTKIGFAGYETPRVVYPTIIGVPKMSGGFILIKASFSLNK